MSDIDTYHNYSANIIQEMFEAAEGVIWSGKSKKDINHNDQQKEGKSKNNDLQITTQKTNDWATQIA